MMVVVNTLSITLGSQDICFTDEDLEIAAHLAYLMTAGAQRSITLDDVLVGLGVRRKTRAWNRRYEIVNPQKLTYILRKAGFVRLSGSKPRYAPLEDVGARTLGRKGE